MRYQSRPGKCGPAVIVNALRCFGKRVSERSISKLAGWSENGVDEFGIQKCLTELSYSFEENEVSNRDEAWGWLVKQLTAGRPVIIYIFNDQHWVLAAGVVNGRIIMIDSGNTKGNHKENGVHVLGRVEFLKRWRCATTGLYYGLGVYK